jgi:hypothetical protein
MLWTRVGSYSLSQNASGSVRGALGPRKWFGPAWQRAWIVVRLASVAGKSTHDRYFRTITTLMAQLCDQFG